MSSESFRNKIKELRESTGLNRKEFCEKFDIPYQTVTEWELGKRTVPSYMRRLLEYYIKTRGLFVEQDVDVNFKVKVEDDGKNLL